MHGRLDDKLVALGEISGQYSVQFLGKEHCHHDRIPVDAAECDNSDAMESTKAQDARQLAASQSTGVLCTMSEKKPGFPFGSVTPYVLDDAGRPLFLMSALAVHTKNLAANAHASLLVAEPAEGEAALSAGRLNLMGVVAEVPEHEAEQARRIYLKKHPEAEQWVEFGDFGFYRLEVTDVYYVGGFGRMGWVSKGDYTAG
jgi:heme iron utilization protein